MSSANLFPGEADLVTIAENKINVIGVSSSSLATKGIVSELTNALGK
jgi:hypothetical protein